jgi:hypothetical protein
MHCYHPGRRKMEGRRWKVEEGIWKRGGAASALPAPHWLKTRDTEFMGKIHATAFPFPLLPSTFLLPLRAGCHISVFLI